MIAERDNSSLRAATLHALTAELACGGDVHALVAGQGASAAARTAAQVRGEAKVLFADAEPLANGLAEEMAAQVVAVAPGYRYQLFTAIAAGKNQASRVAALLDVAQFSEFIGVVAPETFKCPIYTGDAIATVRALTVRTTAFGAAPTGAPAAPVDTFGIAPTLSLSRFTGQQLAQSKRPELASAQVVVSGERCVGSQENFAKVLAPLAERLSAAIGGSWAAVDAGYAANDLQVRQTVKIVAPKLYIAAGISGTIQHLVHRLRARLAGMKDSQVIVAINRDSEALIFGVAAYALQAHLFEAVPELANAL